MAAGVLVGVFAGPNALWVSKTTIYGADASRLTLLTAPTPGAKRLLLPQGVPATLDLVARQAGPDGTYLRLTLRPDPRLGLGRRLGDPSRAHHAVITAYLREAPGVTLVWGPGVTLMALLAPLGEIFMRLIKMLIVPLVFCSLFVGVASLGDVRQLGRLGGKTLGFFMLTTILAITIGVVFANVLKPGKFISAQDKAALSASYAQDAGRAAKRTAEKPSTTETLVRIVPLNPLGAMAAKRPNMLSVIFFALFLGIGATLVPRRTSKQLISLLDRINDAMIMMIHLSMAIAPYGVFALIAQVVGTSGWSVLGALVIYALVVIAGLLFHALVVYTGAVRGIAKIGVGAFWRAIRAPQLIAFSTSSSAVALPIALETARENLGVSRHVSSFVIPLGTTINMDGTALYQGVAAIFIAQVFGIDLSLGAQLNIILTATLASIGTAAVPGVGMITLAMVLTSVGIPTVGVALILGVDRILDMFRSSVNTTGNLAATLIIAVSEGENVRVIETPTAKTKTTSKTKTTTRARAHEDPP